MLFNSQEFLIFFPIVVLVYYVIPKKIKYIWLLITSYYFYMCWNVKYVILIAFSTIITWLSGILLEKTEEKFKKNLIVVLSFGINLSILGFFKYLDFVLANINGVASLFGFPVIEKPFDFLLPVGISFYTFQALSYTMDVYRKEIKAEKNIFKYALFVSFFPQLVAGPIERSKNLLMQIEDLDKKILFNFDKVVSGLWIMLFGFFQKIVIADRIAILVDTVFDSWELYGGVELLIAAFSFSLQIYCDFASYSTIAIGAAKILGFELMENFDTPYFALNIKDFWRRWHISLSTWFKDYLYIPLGGNRKGKVRTYINLMITFLVSGLWHGADWTYVIWGGIHGVYQIVESELNKLLHFFKISFKDSFGLKCLQMLRTFLLTSFAWIFFRAETLSQAIGFIKNIFLKFNLSSFVPESLFSMGLSAMEMHILFFALFFMFFVSIMKYIRKQSFDVFMKEQCFMFQCMVAVAVFAYILLFGIYGPGYDASQFIYFQF